MATYAEKKQLFDSMMTLYGRRPVQEILLDPDADVYRLHLATTNRDGDIIREITSLAEKRGIEIVRHTRQALSRISRNARQDQGVAIDIRPPHYVALDQVPDGATSLIALDAVTNPQNVGMIIRTIAASPIDGLILPRKGCAKIDPLVFKASAGTLFKARIYHCETLVQGLGELKQKGFSVIGLAGDGTGSLPGHPQDGLQEVFVLGNESSGLSDEVRALCDKILSIPLANGVESLNVASAATLVAFRRVFNQG